MKGGNCYGSAAAVLFKVLFPLRVVRWLFWFSLLSIALAQLLVPLMGWDWFNGIAMIGIFLSVFVSFVIIPFQVIALATSRPITLLGNNRRWLLVAIMVMGLLFSLAIYWSINKVPQLGHPVSLLVVWLMVSVLLQLTVWICSRWAGVHGFIFILNATFGHIALWLNERHPTELLITLVVSWALFSYWWLHWQPIKYQSSNIFMSGMELQKRQAESIFGSRMMSGVGHSWVGSRLLGAPDGWFARCKRALSALSILIFFPLPFFMVMEPQKFMPLIQFGAVIFLLVMAGAVSQGIASSFFRNVRSIWLCNSGDRASLFSTAWRCYLRESGPWTLSLIALAMVVEIIFSSWRGIEIWLLFLLSITLIQTLAFYLVWFIYQKTAASFLWCSWVCGLVFLAWLYLICATGLLFPLPFEWQGISTLWIWAPELLAIAVLHKKVRAGFSNMDLLRVV